MDERVPDILLEGWLATRDPRRVRSVEEIRVGVSTNRVYRLVLDDGSHRIAKVSSFGSFVHFRQDHERILRWTTLLEGTRWARFLAPVVARDGRPCLHRDGPSWVAFYEEVEPGEALPRVLSEREIENLAEEMARFHRVCLHTARHIDPTWKTLGSDLALLRDQLDQKAWREARGIGPAAAEFIREHCDAFLVNADALGVHRMRTIPVLVDWNIGNFGVRRGRRAFRLFRRWDYDWFRIAPRTLDFYSLSRVSSSVGDRTQFSYGLGPLFEARFARFLARVPRAAAAPARGPAVPARGVSLLPVELRDSGRRELLPVRAAASACGGMRSRCICRRSPRPTSRCCRTPSSPVEPLGATRSAQRQRPSARSRRFSSWRRIITRSPHSRKTARERAERRRAAPRRRASREAASRAGRRATTT